MKVALALGLALALLMAPAPTPAADKALEDLMFDLQLVPMQGQVPPPLELERSSDGTKVSLAEHRGRPVMLYFWATW
jgi:cytochrome oxidase Cu insertion factor (SCO1/SenC/PrrC family)